MLEEIDVVLARSEGAATTSEEAFLRSIRQQYIQKGSLSPGQHGWFSSLEKKFSEKNFREQQVWKDQWNNNHRDIARKIAHYYRANQPYFSAIVQLVNQDPEGFVLTKKQWDKFCENKYAKRIRAEYDAEPKFKQGDCIQIRKTNKLPQANYNSNLNINVSSIRTAETVGFILKINAAPVVRARKGSKVYQILLAGDAAPIYAHESDLKKARKKFNG
jgi:hypothetical protein